MKIPPIGTPIRCDWFDSVDMPGWHYVALDEKLNAGLRPPMQTRGVLIATDSTSISIATTVAPRGPDDLKEGYLDVLTIPRGCVVAVRVIP